MRERWEQILKIVCLALGLLLAVQLVRVALRVNPLAGATIPDLPSLPADTNAVEKVASNAPDILGTNKEASATSAKTNAPASAGSTHNPAANTAAIASADTNSASAKPIAGTNSSVASSDTNTASHAAPTNTTATASADTNAVSHAVSTNAVAATAPTDTNTATSKMPAPTNALASQSTNSASTNTASLKKPSRKGGGRMAGPMGMQSASLPPEIEARVDRITDSEILGPVMHPMPEGLLGIAGNVAFLRSPSGQTALVKEGDDLGEIKLLRIGTNRVLIQENGEKKELMIFDGYGGESLLPKSTESSNETTNKN